MPVRKITKIKTLLSAVFDFLFFLHPAQIHNFCSKFLKLKSNNKNARNVIYKIKSYFPQTVQGAHNLCKALDIPLYCTFTNIRLLYFAKISTWIKISF